MPKVRISAEQVAEIYSKIARDIGGNQKALGYGSAASSLWLPKPPKQRDIDILVCKVSNIELKNAFLRMEIGHFDGAPAGLSSFGPEDLDQHYAHGGFLFKYGNGGSKPIVVHLVAFPAPGEWSFDIRAEKLFEHSTLRGPDGGVRVMDKNLLVISRWLLQLGKSSAKRRPRDLKTIAQMLDAYYGSSSKKFMKQERDMASDLLGHKAKKFFAFMSDFDIARARRS